MARVSGENKMWYSQWVRTNIFRMRTWNARWCVLLVFLVMVIVAKGEQYGIQINYNGFQTHYGESLTGRLKLLVEIPTGKDNVFDYEEIELFDSSSSEGFKSVTTTFSSSRVPTRLILRHEADGISSTNTLVEDVPLGYVLGEPGFQSLNTDWNYPKGSSNPTAYCKGSCQVRIFPSIRID